MSTGFNEEKVKPDEYDLPVECMHRTLEKCNHSSAPHTHEYIELLYGVKGNFKVWISGKVIDVGPGELVVINSNELHDILSMVEKNEFVVIKFIPQLLYTSEQLIFELKYLLPIIMINPNHQRIFSRLQDDAGFINDTINSIMSEWNGKKYGYEMSIHSDILRLFLRILRCWNKNIDVTDRISLTDEMINAVQKTIEYACENYETVTCEQSAKMCNLSYSYFCRSFKRIMNMSFSEYVNYIKANEAQKLLVTTSMNMTEIAVQSGFTTPSYFIQQFKKIKGMSPKQFRINFLKQVAD